MQKHLAAVSAAAADVHDVLGVARLQHQTVRLRFLDDLKRFFQGDESPQPVAGIIFGAPAKNETGLH